MSGSFEPPQTEGPLPVPGFKPPSWAWLLGLISLVAVLLLSFTLFKTGGSKGTPGLATGAGIPPFAAPLVLSSLDGDVNLARKPNAGGAGAVPACAVRLPGVLTSCALVADKPLVLAFATLDDRCLRQLDTLNAVARAERGTVRIVGVAVRGDRDRWRRLVRERWRFPVVYDRDGAMTAVYGVELCPQITIVRRGGRVAKTLFGEVGAAQLQREIRSALRSMDAA